MALTTQALVEQRLQWDITADPDATVTGLIAAAQDLIEAEFGRPIELANHIETFDGYRVSLWVTHKPIVTVNTLTEDGTALTEGTDFEVYPERGKIIRIFASGYRTYFRAYKPRSIQVDYEGGYQSGDVRFDAFQNLCTEVVARAFRAGAASAQVPAAAGAGGGIQSVSLAGSDSVTFQSAGGGTMELGGGLSRFVYLLEDEKRLCHAVPVVA